MQKEHSRAIARLADWIGADAQAWDQHVEPEEARSQAIASRNYPPGAIDVIIMCNFITEIEMTVAFARELADLADSLTPGGVVGLFRANARLASLAPGGAGTRRRTGAHVTQDEDEGVIRGGMCG